LARLSSKSGHISATAAFLNVQALIDLVPKENRKDVKPMYENEMILSFKGILDGLTIENYS